MPLRDHFRPPLDDWTSWDGFHGLWPGLIVVDLSRRLPRHFVAAPNIHLGSAIEIDVAAFESGPFEATPIGGNDEGGGVATATWAPPQPTLAAASNPPYPDEYEVRVYDTRRGRRLVAAVEIVSPSNLDRPQHRREFVAKCAALIQSRVSVAIVDIVTARTASLYAELIDHLGLVDPSLTGEPPPTYAAACRSTRQGDARRLIEAWSHPLAIGLPLPTLPLWLAENLAVPLELEASYEETCRVLRIA